MLLNVNIQVLLEEQYHLAKVHYYVILKIHSKKIPVAIASIYGLPHKELYESSFQTYVSVISQQDIDVRVFDIKAIHSVVMMALDERFAGSFQDRTKHCHWILMEKPALKVSSMLSFGESMI